MSIPKVVEVALVANLQTLGPTYITSATEKVFDHTSGMLLAARIIITSGMGSHVTGMNQLSGPIPISELELEDDYACYYYPMEMVQQPEPHLDITTGKGTLVICLIISSKNKEQFKSYEHILQRIVSDSSDQFIFENTITGQISKELTDSSKSTLHELYNTINETLVIAEKFEGGSLYNVGLIASLPDDLSYTAKKIMLNPTKGIMKKDIEDKNALQILYQIGLIEYKEIDGITHILPK